MQEPLHPHSKLSLNPILFWIPLPAAYQPALDPIGLDHDVGLLGHGAGFLSGDGGAREAEDGEDEGSEEERGFVSAAMHETSRESVPTIGRG